MSEIDQKNSVLHLVWFEILASTWFGLNWDFARGIMNCLLPDVPVHILHVISLPSQQIKPSNQYYLLEFFVFVVCWLTLFTLSKIHKKWRTRCHVSMILSTLAINQTIVQKYVDYVGSIFCKSAYICKIWTRDFADAAALPGSKAGSGSMYLFS